MKKVVKKIVKIINDENKNNSEEIKKNNSNNKLKILLITHNFPPEWYAGVEIYTYDFAKTLIERGHDVSVLYPKLDLTIKLPTLKEDFYSDIKVYKLLVNNTNLSSHIENHEIENVFAELIRKKRFSIVHFQHTHQFLPFSLLKIAKEQGYKVCLTLHDFWFMCPRTHLYIPKTNTVCSGPETVDKCVHCLLADLSTEFTPAQKASLYYTIAYRSEYVKKLFEDIDFISAPSKYLAKKYISYGFGKNNKIKVLPLGLKSIFRKKVNNINSKYIKFGYIGTIHKLKNVNLLIDAFKTVKGNAKLIIWGNGQSEEIEKIKKAMLEDNRIEYKGSYTYDQLFKVLSNIDIGIVPSLVENYPLVVREFLSAGIPVIASKVGGIPEIITHMENGLLFDPSNKEELIKILQQIIQNPSIIDQLRQKITTIKTIKKDAEEWEKVYEKLIKEKKSSRAKTSIIIPVFNQLKFTKQCFDALYKVTPNELFELIVVNNGSNDGTREFLDDFAKKHFNVEVIHNQENLGFAKACNQGARVAKGKYLVFLNNDTIPLASWLEEMIKAAERDKNVGIVGSKLIFPDDTIQHAGVVVYDFPYPVFPCHIYYRKPADISEANIIKEYQAVTGACMLIHKDIFERIGGFDEEFLNGYEDVDLCFRVRELGYNVIYCPNSMLYHFEGQTEGRHNLEKENLERLNQKWVNKIKPDKKVDSLSIIIVTHNSLNDLPSCLKSILSFTSLEHYEIIIIDNNSVDGTKQFLKSLQEKASFLIKLIFNEENLGFSKACNQGIKKARGKYIVLLNPDTVVTPDWDKRMIAHFADGVGAVGPVSNYAAALQNLSLYLQDLPPTMDSAAINQISEKMFKQYRGKSIETKLLIGFCLMTKKEILNKLEMLDENLFLGNDDLELSWRLRLNGYKLVVAPDVFVYHKGQASFKTKPSHETEKLVQESTDKLAEKLIKHYGFGNVPLPEELWGINWFKPSAKYSGMFKQLDKKVSIVILNYKLPEDTLECIQSIYNNIYEKFQIIVVDNGSQDGSVEKIINWAEKNKKRFIYCKEKNFVFPEEKFKQELVIIENKENLGFAGGNNIGIKYALNCGADYIWLLNNDTVVEKDTLESSILLAERLKAERQEKVGLISSKIYCYKDRTMVQYNGGKPFYKGIPDKEGELPRSVKFAPCCSLLINRKLLEEIGLLNEDYFLYYEDTEFCTRTLKAGWTIWYNPYSKVYHKGGASIGLWLQSPLSAYYATRNILLCQFQINPAKVGEIFVYLRNGYWQELRKERQCVFAFVKAIKDFLKAKTGKVDIDFENNVEKYIKEIEGEKEEIANFLQNLPSLNLQERLEIIGKSLVLNFDKKEILDQFINLAQSVFFREYFHQKNLYSRP